MHVPFIFFLNSEGSQSKQTLMCLRLLSKVWLRCRHCYLIYCFCTHVGGSSSSLPWASSRRYDSVAPRFLCRMCLQHAFCFVFDASCFSVSIFKVSCFFLNNSCFDVSCFYVSCFSWKIYVSMFLVFLWKIKFFNSRIVQYQESCSPQSLLESCLPQSFAEAHQLLLSNLARTSCLSFFYKIIYDALHYLFKQIGKVL